MPLPEPPPPSVKPPARSAICRRLAVYYAGCAALLVGCIAHLQSTTKAPLVLPTRLRSHAVRCVKFSPNGQSREGIGALLRRNQLGMFIADTFDARVAWPDILSDHGYAVQDMFDQCSDPADECVLNESRMYLPRCPRRDCACHRRYLARYTDPLAERCKVLGYVNQKVRTMEWSGCTIRTMERYFGTDTKPVVEYDAVHVRAGDMAGRKGGKVFRPHELFYILKALCQLSERDIVICTEGQPEIPIPMGCEDRLVLASDTSVVDVFRIFQHATSVSVGVSSLATMVMEIAKPKHVVMLERSLPKYEWVDCENWTLIESYGAVFHFESKELMVKAALSGQSLTVRSLRTLNQHGAAKFKLGVPTRIWSNDTRMSWAVKKQKG